MTCRPPSSGWSSPRTELRPTQAPSRVLVVRRRPNTHWFVQAFHGDQRQRHREGHGADARGLGPRGKRAWDCSCTDADSGGQAIPPLCPHWTRRGAMARHQDGARAKRQRSVKHSRRSRESSPSPGERLDPNGATWPPCSPSPSTWWKSACCHPMRCRREGRRGRIRPAAGFSSCPTSSESWRDRRSPTAPFSPWPTGLGSRCPRSWRWWNLTWTTSGGRFGLEEKSSGPVTGLLG